MSNEVATNKAEDSVGFGITWMTHVSNMAGGRLKASIAPSSVAILHLLSDKVVCDTKWICPMQTSPYGRFH
jgi:hypothetical protein